MNDATRELGAALGIAVLGSVAAARYSHSIDQLRNLPAAARDLARDSLSGALAESARIGGSAGSLLRDGSQQAFIDGMHLAVTFGAVLAAIASVLVYRYLPAQTPMIAGHGPIGAVDAAELTAEVAIAGTPALIEGVPVG